MMEETPITNSSVSVTMIIVHTMHPAQKRISTE